MTEAGWTSAKLQSEGFYWYREDGREYVVHMLLVNGRWLVSFTTGRRELLTSLRGEWLGPISPTDRQQGRVAGLREAAAIICEFCADSDYWAPMSNSGYHCGVNGSKLRKCKAERIYERIAEIDAQAAQDEKGVGE